MSECQSRHVGSWVIRVSFDGVRVTSAFLPIAGGGYSKPRGTSHRVEADIRKCSYPPRIETL
jgi:hypothetical protein